MMRHLFVAVFVLILTATAFAEVRPEDTMVTNMPSELWLTTYESPEWATSATNWVHGFIGAATMFGGIQCPQELSARTLAAATADTIKQRKRPKEDVAIAVIYSAHKLNCSIDFAAMRRAADLPTCLRRNGASKEDGSDRGRDLHAQVDRGRALAQGRQVDCATGGIGARVHCPTALGAG
jgi:hypothetical protein